MKRFTWLKYIRRATPAQTGKTMSRPVSGIWHVEVKQPRSIWGRYRFVAVARENGDTFRLECSWENYFYILEVWKNGRGPEHSIFSRSLLDGDNGQLDKYVEQIMRIADHDIGNRLARIDRRYKDEFLAPRDA